ncbi:MAG: hypothetical protein SFX19_01780 [Alphaproteobacteria bacterium]|nr:hypothetical protein [Alphaproteobacteria bacterium]
MNERIWNLGSTSEAMDRYTKAQIGGITTHVALAGNRRSDRNKKQNDRLAVLDLPGCDMEMCRKIMTSVQRNALSRFFSLTCMGAYEPKTQVLEVYGKGDCSATLVLTEGEKIKAIHLTPSKDFKDGHSCIVKNLSETLDTLAKEHGFKREKTKIGLLLNSDGIMETTISCGYKAVDPEHFPQSWPELIERLFHDAYAKPAENGSNIAKALADVAIKRGTGDNISVIWMPDLLAATPEGPPVIACVCDTPGEGSGAENLITHFENACKNAVWEKRPDLRYAYRPSELMVMR